MYKCSSWPFRISGYFFLVLCNQTISERGALRRNSPHVKSHEELLLTTYRPERVTWPFLIQGHTRGVSSFIYSKIEEKKIIILMNNLMDDTDVCCLPTSKGPGNPHFPSKTSNSVLNLPVSRNSSEPPVLKVRWFSFTHKHAHLCEL